MFGLAIPFCHTHLDNHMKSWRGDDWVVDRKSLSSLVDELDGFLVVAVAVSFLVCGPVRQFGEVAVSVQTP